jgi:hypothetical protein
MQPSRDLARRAPEERRRPTTFPATLEGDPEGAPPPLLAEAYSVGRARIS